MTLVVPLFLVSHRPRLHLFSLDVASNWCSLYLHLTVFVQESVLSIQDLPLLLEHADQPSFALSLLQKVFIIPPPIRKQSIVISVSVCLCVCVCLSAIISSELHVRSSPVFVHVSCWRGSVLCQRSDTFRISGFMDDVIFAHKLRLLNVAARLRQWASHSHTALSLARRNTCCRQRTLGTTSCSQPLLGHSGNAQYLVSCLHMMYLCI